MNWRLCNVPEPSFQTEQPGLPWRRRWSCVLLRQRLFRWRLQPSSADDGLSPRSYGSSRHQPWPYGRLPPCDDVRHPDVCAQQTDARPLHAQHDASPASPWAHGVLARSAPFQEDGVARSREAWRLPPLRDASWQPRITRYFKRTKNKEMNQHSNLSLGHLGGWLLLLDWRTTFLDLWWSSDLLGGLLSETRTNGIGGRNKAPLTAPQHPQLELPRSLRPLPPQPLRHCWKQV